MKKSIKFIFLKRHLFITFCVSGSDDALESFVGVFDGRVISAEDSKCAVGFKLHFIDIFMEELTKVNATFSEQDLLTDDRLETLLEPFLRYAMFPLKMTQRPLFLNLAILLVVGAGIFHQYL